MVELSLKERLQPALLDRLIDDERHVTFLQITVRTDQLAKLAISAQELLAVLCAQGLKLEASEVSRVDDESITWRLVGNGAAPSAARLKAFVLKPPGARLGIELQAFCSIEFRTVLNAQLDPGARHMISMRRLRDCVQRNLSWLLNTGQLAALQDLGSYPHVARSVVNYGMPSLTGRLTASVDLQLTAERIREAITTFEPRLSRIQVTPESQRESDEASVSFLVDAELWGQPVSQHLVLRTSIDVDSGDVRVTDVS